MDAHPSGSRRTFVSSAIAAIATLGTAISARTASAETLLHSSLPSTDAPPPTWDLSWLRRLKGATDRALFDWPMLGDPADPQVLWFGERYLDNCQSVYGGAFYRTAVVFNIRTQAVPAALSDALWERYALGVEYRVNDPSTGKPATSNPFWHPAPEMAPGIGTTSLARFVERGAVLLVCDFALGHLAKRLATKFQREEAIVHKELIDGFVRGAYAVPSGVFGMAKAQNAGCALVRMT